MLNHFLQSNPAIRLVLPFLVGIILGNNLNVSSHWLLISLIIIACCVLLSRSLKVFFSFLNAFFINLFFVVFGIFIVQNMKAKYVLPNGLTSHYVKAVVRAEADEKKRSTAVLLEIIQLQKDKTILSTHFKSMVYFAKDDKLLQWNYGDTVVGKLQFLALHDNENPYAFNYAKLLKQRQIYCTARGNSKHIVHFPATDFSPIAYAHKIQKKLRNILDSYIPNAKASGFLQAMTLGDKTSLSPEVRVDFADAGVVHILAVSGLHVGILFFLINIFLRPLRATKRGRLLLFFIGIVVIWCFAFISGLSVSILRAAIMFSVLQMSVLSLRPYRVYNAIAVSAFLVLLINPFYIYEVGFQLSYLAVLSIVTFLPLWNRGRFANTPIRKLQDLILVSLAAQLGVAPLALYYFHHLPTYFLLGNIIILLAAPILLGGSLLILTFSAIPLFAKALGTMLSIITQVCLWLINHIASLPGALLINYTLNFNQMLLLYAIIVCLLFYTLKKRSRYFIIFLGALFAFIATTTLRNWQENHQSLFVVHSLNGKSCYSLLSGKEALLFSHEILQEETLDYSVRPLWNAKNIRHITRCMLNDKLEITQKNNFYKNGYAFANGKTILFYPQKLGKMAAPVDIDILVLTANSDWKALLKNYQAKQIVLDSSFAKWKSQELTKKLSALNLVVHNVNTKGAFVLD